VPATTSAPFECNTTPPTRSFADVQSELVGKAVVLTDGKAGTVESVWLDELHGLRISIRGHVGKWPISTIKMQQGRENAGPV
jgi:hypothetical protein